MVSMDEHSKAGPKAEETQKKQPEKRTRMMQPVELTLGACGAKFKNPQEENRGLNVLSLLHCHPAVMIMLLFSFYSNDYVVDCFIVRVDV